MAKRQRALLFPAGMNKMVVNHLDKLIVTNDASTIISELEVEHPAAKLLALAARAQEQEIGDATNLVLGLPIERRNFGCGERFPDPSVLNLIIFSVQVLAFGGELLSNAEALLRSGLHTTEVADGYLKAGSKV